MRDALIFAMGVFVVLVLVAGAAMWSMGLRMDDKMQTVEPDSE